MCVLLWVGVQRVIVSLSMKTLKARRTWSNTLNILNHFDSQADLIDPIKLSPMLEAEAV